MNRLTTLGVFAKWWLETTTELGKEGVPRPFRIYVELQQDLALMETIRKPPSRQTEMHMFYDPDCIGTAEYFACLLSEEDDEDDRRQGFT